MESRTIPLTAKLLLTAFVAVLTPQYWRIYGPTNFLYFCDVALFMALAAIWTENALLASMPAVGILLPQLLWCLDFLAGIFGWQITGLSAYMFKSDLSLFTRALSLFHFWLPFLLLWMMARLGYDRRALAAWTALAWLLVVICYLFMPAPPPSPDRPHEPVNINYAYGFDDERAQQWLPPRVYVVCLMAGMFVGVFLPTHWLLCKMYSNRPAGDSPC